MFVELARAVEAQADKKLVLTEKPAPLRVQSRAVGLDRIGNRASASMFFLEFHHASEVIHSE
jgi:hypothetical protein